MQNISRDIEVRATRQGASVLAFRAMEKLIEGYKSTLAVAADSAGTTINERQRNINREFAPDITSHMLKAYADCESKSGKGVFAVMRQIMHTHIQNHKNTMFNEGISKVKLLLVTLIADVEKLLLTEADEICIAINRDYTRIVLGGDDDNTEAGRKQRETKQDVMGILEGTEFIFKQVLSQAPDKQGAQDSSSVAIEDSIRVKDEAIDGA